MLYVNYKTLALILLFIAPSAWGQVINGPTLRCQPGEAIRFYPEGVACEAEAVIFNSPGTFIEPKCDPGWTLVMGERPQCAWVLKEPIYK